MKSKKIRMALYAVLIGFAVVAFSSCEKSINEPMANELHDKNHVDAVASDVPLELRSSDWIEFPYNPAVAVQYLLKTPRKLTEN